jgi:hypothetical protein
MTNQELYELEFALGVNLPEAYRTLLLHPPFTEDSSTAQNLGLHDLRGLIRDNKTFREYTDRRSKLQPPERYFVIGSMDCAYYAIDLQGDEALPVLEISFRPDREVYSTYESLDEFIRIEQESEQEAAEHDAKEAAAEASASPWRKRLIIAGYILGWVLYIVYKAQHS